MKIKTNVKKRQSFEVDAFKFETSYGSQSTDYFLTLYANGKKVNEYDVRSIEEAIQILVQLADAHPIGCRCEDCENLSE